MKESVFVCNANKLPLFGGVFSTPRQSSRTTASLPYTFNVHCTAHSMVNGYASEAHVRRYAAKPTSANSLTIVRAAPDWPTLVANILFYNKNTAEKSWIHTISILTCQGDNHYMDVLKVRRIYQTQT